MKQIILILAHKDASQVKKLIEYFDGKCDIFIHIDKKSKSFTKADVDTIKSMPGVKHVFRKYSVHWAGFSILKTEMFLLKKALEYSSGEYIHLLSGQDYPLRPLSEFNNYFSSTHSFGYLDCVHLPAPNWDSNTYFRLQYYVLTDFFEGKTPKGKKRIHKLIQLQQKLGIKRNIPLYVNHLYGGSAWFSISREAAKYLIDYTEHHTSLYNRFKYTFYPEEMYVSTVLMNSPFNYRLTQNNNCRSIFWNNPGIDTSPKELTTTNIYDLLKCNDSFFARKFERPMCLPLEKFLDNYLLKDEKCTCSKTGFWVSKSLTHYKFNKKLCERIIQLCIAESVQSVIDLGCGPGLYVKEFINHGIPSVGYDGNSLTSYFSSTLSKNGIPLCFQADITEEFEVEMPFDMTICINVLEYIPLSYWQIVIDNFVKCTNNYLVICLNYGKLCSSNLAYLKKNIESRGFIADSLASYYIKQGLGKEFLQENVIYVYKLIEN